MNSSLPRVLILQHPQEARHPLNTAHLVTSPLAQVRVGLSWRNLSAALGVQGVEGRRWGAMYLGGRTAALDLPDDPGLYVEKGDSGTYAPLMPGSLDGVVLIDATWKKAKTLLWRNPWIRKLPHIVWVPDAPSGFSQVRRGPRTECRSTVEAASACLNHWQ